MTPNEFRAALERLEMPPAAASVALGVALPSVYRYAKGSRPIPKQIELAVANIEKLRAFGESPAELYQPMTAREASRNPTLMLEVDKPEVKQASAAAYFTPAAGDDPNAGVLRLIGRLQDDLDSCRAALDQAESALGVGDTQTAVEIVALARQRR